MKRQQMIGLCVCCLGLGPLAAFREPPTSPPAAAARESVGVVFTGFTAWWDGRWPVQPSMDRVRTTLLRFLEQRSSRSPAKLKMLQVGSVEEARSQGIDIVFALDYHEETAAIPPTAAEVIVADVLVGVESHAVAADILCTFRRADQSSLATNWDDLSVVARGVVWGDPAVQMRQRELVFLGNFVTAIPELEIRESAPPPSRPRAPVPGSQSASASAASLAKARSSLAGVARLIDGDYRTHAANDIAGATLHAVQPGPGWSDLIPYLIWNLDLQNKATIPEEHRAEVAKTTPVNEYGSAVIGDLAVQALIRQGPKARLAMLDALHAEDEAIRAKAAWGLGNLRDDSVIDAVLGALRDESHHVRGAAVRGLGDSRSSLAVGPLVAAMRHPPESPLSLDQRLVAQALGELGDGRAVEVLVAALDRPQNPPYKDWVRTDAIEALGRIGDARAVEPLIGLLARETASRRDKDTGAMIEVADALAAIGDRRAVEPLLAAMSDIPKYAGLALAKIADPRAVDAVSSVLHENPRIAVEGLARMGDPRAVGPLIAALESGRITETGLQQIRAALRSLTGKDCGEEAAAWRAWWERKEGCVDVPVGASSTG